PSPPAIRSPTRGYLPRELPACPAVTASCRFCASPGPGGIAGREGDKRRNERRPRPPGRESRGHIMSDQQSVQGVTYEKVGAEYFEKRGLRRFAGAWSLWALGVGAVISGDFFGWNYGLATGGFGGLFVATLIVSVMYVCLCYSLAEMAPALPHTGGAYSFARTAMGPWAGFLTGLGENMEYVITPGVIIVSVGAYLESIFGTPPAVQWVWWVMVFVIFVGLNIWGVELSFRFTVLITFIALAILVFFFLAALSAMDFNK